MLAVGLVLQEVRNRSVRMMVDAKIFLMLCYVVLLLYALGVAGDSWLLQSSLLEGHLTAGGWFYWKTIIYGLFCYCWWFRFSKLALFIDKNILTLQTLFDFFGCIEVIFCALTDNRCQGMSMCKALCLYPFNTKIYYLHSLCHPLAILLLYLWHNIFMGFTLSCTSFVYRVWEMVWSRKPTRI